MVLRRVRRNGHPTTDTPVNRTLRFVALSLLVTLGASAALAEDSAPAAIDPAKAKAENDGALLWYDLKLLHVEGQGWSDTLAPYDRFPKQAEKTVPASVWGLSRHSAGLCARFVTDATTLQARWTLTSANLAMPHMPATGVSGLDLYVKTESGKWRWLANGRPSAQTNTATLYSGIPAGTREYLLYLPLYNGVSSVELGLPKGTSLSQARAWSGGTKPIIFYGTSITQGGCASRPGMVHTAILQRRLNTPVINLGFSGNGRLDPGVGDLMAEVDAAVYVLDCLPNMNDKEVTERTDPFVKKLRAARPDTPILLVEDRTYSNSFLITGSRTRNETSRAALKAAYERLKAEGVKGLYYLDGESLLADDGEGTVDNSHPTDLGFVQHADAFEKVLRPLLGKNR